MKFFGGGKRMFVFIVRRWFGVSGFGEDGVVNLFVVSGLLFIIVFVLYMKVWSDLLFNCWLEFCRSVYRIGWMEWICFF